MYVVRGRRGGGEGSSRWLNGIQEEKQAYEKIKNIKSGKLGFFRISEVRFFIHSEGK